MASVIIFGEAPHTLGGDFERHCVATLGAKLPEEYVVVAHIGLHTRQSHFYDVDVIVASSESYDVLECKLIAPEVVVGEDFISGNGGYCADNVFSIHENKCRVLGSRLGERPFSHARDIRAVGRVIVPDDSEIRFLCAAHQTNGKVIRLRDFVRDVRARPSPRPVAGVPPVERQWREYRSSYSAPGQNRDGRVGRFMVKRRLESAPGFAAYLAQDEPPCKVDVHLLEIPFPKGVKGKELDAYLAEASRAMAALRRLRHPLIQCVTGHFYTGSSLVQISDWFNGSPLERLLSKSLSIDDKILLMSRIAEALVYCHQQSVFHRNLSPANVLVGGGCGDIQLTGFECVKDSQQAGTAVAAELQRRDRRILPPEELQPAASVNYRLYDMFQAGVLFYWILEDGRWPFDSTLDYVTGDGRLVFSGPSDDRHRGLVKLVSEMLARNPADRPDPFSRVLGVLQDLG